MRWWLLSLVQRKTLAAIREKKKKDTLNIYPCQAVSTVTFGYHLEHGGSGLLLQRERSTCVVIVGHEEHPCKHPTGARRRGQGRHPLPTSADSPAQASPARSQHVAALQQAAVGAVRKRALPTAQERACAARRDVSKTRASICSSPHTVKPRSA